MEDTQRVKAIEKNNNSELHRFLVFKITVQILSNKTFRLNVFGNFSALTVAMFQIRPAKLNSFAAILRESGICLSVRTASLRQKPKPNQTAIPKLYCTCNIQFCCKCKIQC